jgi:hypothetical protein
MSNISFISLREQIINLTYGIQYNLPRQCSSLKADLIKIHVVDHPKESCGSPIEDAIHYLLECQLYYNQGISLFNDLINMNIEINIEALLFGNYS